MSAAFTDYHLFACLPACKTAQLVSGTAYTIMIRE